GSAGEGAWDDLVGRGRDPEVPPLVLDSWVRSRDLFHVDAALERSPIILPEDEWRRRRERLEALRAGAPVLERLGDELRETEDMLALCDADGYVLVTGVIRGSSSWRTSAICASARAGTSGPPATTGSARRGRRDARFSPLERS